MRNHPFLTRVFCCGLLFVTLAPLRAQEPPLVNIKSVDPTIVVDLRYATSRNISGAPLYPANMPALLRPEVARRLALAQATLRTRKLGLKIWDAYRPKAAHEQLWQYWPDNDYVASPAEGGSLHTRGVAVDATLVDLKGRDVKMPTDFDDFTPAAMLAYAGTDQTIKRNLRLLQYAMARAGFYGLRTEWWHFVSKDWQSYPTTDAGAPQPPISMPMPITPSTRASGGPSARGFTR